MLPLTFSLCADEGDVRQEQRFLPDGRWPAEHHGRARGSVLAGHSAASPAHREGNVRRKTWPLKHQTSPLISQLWLTFKFWLSSCVQSMISLANSTQWPVHISILWSVLMTEWLFGQLLRFLAFKAQFSPSLLWIKKLPTHWSLETLLIPPHFSCKGLQCKRWSSFLLILLTGSFPLAITFESSHWFSQGKRSTAKKRGNTSRCF